MDTLHISCQVSCCVCESDALKLIYHRPLMNLWLSLPAFSSSTSSPCCLKCLSSQSIYRFPQRTSTVLNVPENLSLIHFACSWCKFTYLIWPYSDLPSSSVSFLPGYLLHPTCRYILSPFVCCTLTPDFTFTDLVSIWNRLPYSGATYLLYRFMSYVLLV